MFDVVVNLLVSVINILPLSPFVKYVNDIGTIDGLSMLNWFVPFDIFIVMLESWVVCMGAYYLYRAIRSRIQGG